MTKMGLMLLFEVSEGSLLIRSKISKNHLLSGCAL